MCYSLITFCEAIDVRVLVMVVEVEVEVEVEKYVGSMDVYLKLKKFAHCFT